LADSVGIDLAYALVLLLLISIFLIHQFAPGTSPEQRSVIQ